MESEGGELEFKTEAVKSKILNHADKQFYMSKKRLIFEFWRA